jgi:tryptophan synthase beta chain
MYAYQKFNDGLMSDYIPTDEEIAVALSKTPVIPE